MVASRQLLLALLVLFSSAALSAAVSTSLVINEIDYDQPGTDTTEFIELKNVGASNINLTNWNLQLVNGANNAIYLTIPLAPVTLAPGGYFVICSTAGTVPNCNQTNGPDNNLIQNGAPDAMGLTDPSGNIIDRVSYEGLIPGYSEGTSAVTDTDAGTTSISRCPDGTDTDDNGVDFVLVSTTPGTANACSGSATPSPTTSGTGTPAPTGTAPSCTSTAGETPISTINGNGAAPNLVNTTVVVRGFLTGAFDAPGQLSGFFIQTPDMLADDDTTTSNGIFVYFGSSRANFMATAVGDEVQVSGTVANFNGLPEITMITSVAVCSIGNALPAVRPIMLSPMAQNLRQYLSMLVSFGPEPLTVTDVFQDDFYGEIELSVNGRRYVPTQIAAPGDPARAVAAANAAQTILIDDGSSRTGSSSPLNPIPYPAPGLSDSNPIRVGYTLTSPLVGDLSFGNSYGFLLEPTSPPASNITFSSATNPRPTAPPAVGGRLKVVAFNLENFFTSLQGPGCSSSLCRGASTPEEYQTQLSKSVLAIEALNADVYTLQELQNNGFNAGSAIVALVNAVNAKVGAGTFDFIRVNTGDGGSPSIISTDPNCNSQCVGSDAITVGQMYRVSAVTPVGVARALTKNIDPDFNSDIQRPSVAQTYMEISTGAKFTVVANHLKSKGSGCGAGDPDNNDGQGNCNLTRKRAAEALVRWLATDPTGSNDPDFVLAGDMNSYAMEDPIKAFEAGGYTNLIRQFLGDFAYSYVFNGESGYLDHALASPSLVSQVTGVGEFHINADEQIALGYASDTGLANPNSFYRTSDHDPLIFGLDLVADNGPATATPTPTPTATAPAPAPATATPTPTPTATANAPVATIPVPCPPATPAPTFPVGGVCDYAGPTPNQCFNSAGNRYICCATACPNTQPGVDPVCSGTPAPVPTACFATATPAPTTGTSGPTSTPASTTPGSTPTSTPPSGTPASTPPSGTPAATTPAPTTTPQVLPVGGTCDPYGSAPNQCFAANGQTYVCCSTPCPTGAPGAVPRCA
ncbi:hypothetical protein KFL_001810135 [Klebsormidium nitens]|uniref:LTD domain-containing protein n=1 Tax=Klebsormidium nitens TaxID=105231 RepID=A0A1Y1I192_KLENI|nr:hypothetical protein KFL_001810135 [Klebsormidium nitens]|eukprot:GAQ84233.1 hypothetical protein KFL_001810135 [Klebsormidium nitens]